MKIKKKPSNSYFPLTKLLKNDINLLKPIEDAFFKKPKKKKVNVRKERIRTRVKFPKPKKELLNLKPLQNAFFQKPKLPTNGEAKSQEKFGIDKEFSKSIGNGNKEKFQIRPIGKANL